MSAPKVELSLVEENVRQGYGLVSLSQAGELAARDTLPNRAYDGVWPYHAVPK